MATSLPPTYYFNGITYNDAFFNTNISLGGGVTQSYADSAYLARTGFTTSRATKTSFLGSVNVTGGLSALDPSTIVTTSNTANSITTLGSTTNVDYTIPFVTSQASTFSQILYTDSGPGANLSYNPSSNILTVGSTTTGGISITGTSSSMSIAGTGNALTLASGNIQCSGTGNVIQAPNGTITLGTTPNMTYTTLPTLVTTQIGYYTYIPATLPSTLTKYASAVFIPQSVSFTLSAGVYILSLNIALGINSATAGNISNVISGISTSNTSFVGGNYYYVGGYQTIPAAGFLGQTLIYTITRTIVITTSTNYYLCTSATYSGTTLSMSISSNYAQITRIA